jgi:demethylmenaquinone methyltransferase/2-methoxy-6-polyprenyl-1,4-benzoquinol methylase
MNKKEIAEFFDRCAPWWDDDMIRHEDIISTILDNGGIRKDIHVLDVACGTGVLFPDYLKRGVASVTGIDISPEMVKIAQSKFPDVKIICGDVENTEFEHKFDAIMVYNAFPHFPDPENLIRILAGMIKPGGKLSVAHGMSRAALIDHHKRARKVSIDVLEEHALATLFTPYFEVDVRISNDRMYQVSGVRREHDLPAAIPQIPQSTPMDELLALMKYMVDHNDAHAQELTELADQLKQAGKARAYQQIMDAVANFDIANAKLNAVLTDLTTE